MLSFAQVSPRVFQAKATDRVDQVRLATFLILTIPLSSAGNHLVAVEVVLGTVHFAYWVVILFPVEVVEACQNLPKEVRLSDYLTILG